MKKVNTFCLTILTLLFCQINLAFAQIQKGNTIEGVASGDTFSSSIELSADGKRIAIGARANDSNGTNSGQVQVFDFVNGNWQQVGSDIVGESQYDWSGVTLSMSADGTRIAIGATDNDGNGIGAGHVRVFDFLNNDWVQIGNDIDGEAPDDKSAWAIALSDDGTTLAISARNNDGNGNDSGHVRVFKYQNQNWNQIGNDIHGEHPEDVCCYSVSLSANGSRLAIGAPSNDDYGINAGQARVFDYTSNGWIQVGNDLNGNQIGGSFGTSLGLSDDGQRLVVSAVSQDDGITNNGAGQILAYDFDGSNWVQAGDDINGLEVNEDLGFHISVSGNGNRIVAGVPQNDNNGVEAGQGRVFEFANGSWSQLGISIDGENTLDYFGTTVAISQDGNTFAIGSWWSDGTFVNAGEVRVYDQNSTDLVSTNDCFTLMKDTNPDLFILEGDFSNCNIFVLDENENVVQFLLNIFDKITVEVSDLPDGLHFIRVEHQTHPELSIQHILKQ